MPSGTSRILLVVTLVVGFAAGWLLRPPPPAALPKPGPSKAWHITVGPDPCTLTDADVPSHPKAPPQKVDRKQPHSITWTSDANENLYIVLHVPGACATQPFANAKKLGQQDADGRDLYLVGDGKAARVESGRVDANACPSDESNQKTWIKYDQCLQLKGQDQFWCCDGWIIVER